jgi:hypothetical protein
VAAFAGVAVRVGDLNAKLLRGDHIDVGEHAVVVSSWSGRQPARCPPQTAGSDAVAGPIP